MKLHFLYLLAISISCADWTSDMVSRSNQLYTDTKDKTVLIYNENIKGKPLTQEEIEIQRHNNIWTNVIDELNDGVEYIDKLSNAPESAWLAADKEDIKGDINKLFEKIINALIDDNLVQYQTNILDLKQKVDQNKEKIINYREKRAGAPITSAIYTTKTGYDDKIKEVQNENEILYNEIQINKNHLQKKFSDIGVQLTPEQIDVLLVRVDSDDIVRITLVMNALKDIMQQISTLMKESSEELQQAKKYYGMHQILLELVVYTQQQYIDKLKIDYIPEINRIITDSKNMMETTRQLARQEEDSRRKSVYQKNIDTLQETDSVANMYRADLLNSLAKMIEAQKLTKANLKLSINTYRTVSLSADLYDLVSESQNLFSNISKIQVPDLVPFENIQIKNKYRELTESLQ